MFNLNWIDISIILVYFVAMIVIGIAVMKRASKSMDSYFLASNKLPWWILGVSNASAMWDITGTMWLVYNLFVYGMKGTWLPWLWPTFNQVILMVYLASWVRRSGVLTGAEWITTRFGGGRGRRAFAGHHHGVRPGERGRIHRIRLPGNGQVLRDIPALGLVTEYLRDHRHEHNGDLRPARRHDQRGHH